MREYSVYIMSNASKTLYVGMTNNLIRRVAEHKAGKIPGFTRKYNIQKLVYFESDSNVNEVIYREKVIKKWRRKKKIALIESINPDWKDLSLEWMDLGPEI